VNHQCEYSPSSRHSAGTAGGDGLKDPRSAPDHKSTDARSAARHAKIEHAAAAAAEIIRPGALTTANNKPVKRASTHTYPNVGASREGLEPSY
jgi:hypothetical protein